MDTEATTAPEYMTPLEVADLLRVHANSVLNWLREGRIPAVKVGAQWRIRRADLDKWLTDHEQSHEPTVPAGVSK
ncbi:MAG: helix-turn-helix domain-containing protein [Patescibacteria group bacterium]|nr:helix-turn-helix domain-containing protein [Patescibacteria group bacterium]